MTSKTLQNSVFSTTLSTSPTQSLDEAPSLLTIPAETRVRIYEALFSGLILSPGWRDLGPGSRQALIQGSRSSAAVLLNRSISNYAAEPPRHPKNLSVLVTCRKIYDEAYPAFLQFTTFSLATIEDHIRLTQPRMIPLLGRIHKLSVGNSILAEWSSTLVRLILPAVSHFEIRDIISLIPHDYMLSADSRLSNTEGRQHIEASLDTKEALALLQNLLLSTRSTSDINNVISHLTAAADVYKCLVLHFQIDCYWGNMAPHEHPSKNVVFTFGERPRLAHGPSLTTLPPAQWAETAFITHESFPLAHKNWDTSSPPSSSEDESSIGT